MTESTWVFELPGPFAKFMFPLLFLNDFGGDLSQNRVESDAGRSPVSRDQGCFFLLTEAPKQRAQGIRVCFGVRALVAPL